MNSENNNGSSNYLSESFFDIFRDTLNGPEENIAVETVSTQMMQNDFEGDYVDSAAGTSAVSETIEPKIVIVEQPASNEQKFRYPSEERFSGVIPGVNSTSDNQTFTTIKVVGWEGEVKILVSLVTKDEPYRAHPYNLVGKDDNFDLGIFTKILREGSHQEVFKTLAIQCVKRIKIREALDSRELLGVDPFNQGFAHRDQRLPSEVLDVVRLCFQADLILPGGGIKSLRPVVSHPIYDKKKIFKLNINHISRCAGKASGDEEMTLLCNKVDKNHIEVRFFEVNENGDKIWERYGEFTPDDVHQQTAIVLKTPRYDYDIDDKTKFYIELYRWTDNATSNPIEFEYYANPAKRKRRVTDAINIAKHAIQKGAGSLNLRSNFSEASFSTNTNPLPTQTFLTQPGPSSTPDLRYEKAAGPSTSQCSNFNAVSLQGQNNLTLEQEFLHEYMNMFKKGSNAFNSGNTLPPHDNANKSKTTYATLEPRHNNNTCSPTNTYWDRTTQLPHQHNFGQNQTFQQPMHSRMRNMALVQEFEELHIIQGMQQQPMLNHYQEQYITEKSSAQPQPLQPQQQQQLNLIAGTQPQQQQQTNFIAETQQQQQQQQNLITGTQPQQQQQLNLIAGTQPQQQQQLNLIAGTQPQQQHQLNLIASTQPQKQLNLIAGTQPQQQQQLNLIAGTQPQQQQQLNLIAGTQPQQQQQLNINSGTHQLNLNVGTQQQHQLNLIAGTQPQQQQQLNLIAGTQPQQQQQLNLIAGTQPQQQQQLNLIAGTQPQQQQQLNINSGTHQLNLNVGTQQQHQLNLIAGTQPQQQQQLKLIAGTQPHQQHQLNLIAGTQPQQQLNLIEGTQPQQQQQLNLIAGTQPQQQHKLNLIVGTQPQQQNYRAGTQLQQQQQTNFNAETQHQQQHSVEPTVEQYQIESDDGNDSL